MMTQQEEVMTLTEQHLEALEAELKKSWVERDHDYVSGSVLGLLTTIHHHKARADALAAHSADRNAVIEECAKIIEGMDERFGSDIAEYFAKIIRSIKQ